MQGHGGQTVQEQLRALLHAHHANLLQQIDVLGRLLSEVGAGGGDRAAPIAEAETIAHQIKGAGGSIGFPQISLAATALDDVLKDLKAQDRVSPAEMQTCLSLFANLRQFAEATTPESSELYNADLSGRTRSASPHAKAGRS